MVQAQLFMPKLFAVLFQAPVALAHRELGEDLHPHALALLQDAASTLDLPLLCGALLLRSGAYSKPRRLIFRFFRFFRSFSLPL